MDKDYNIWWGPPKKISTQITERKISWLELFYDLVYVIVISRITHYLAEHPGWVGLFDYVYVFAMIFWGWYNGSIHHDLHGNPGIRTRFVILWQMMAVGALAVTLDSPPESFLYRTTLAFLFLQVFITYLWWSVGIYDKEHRKRNRPYTHSFLAAFTLLIITLWAPFPYKRILFVVILGLNYLPYLLTARKLKKDRADLRLSPNMTERLGLLTIIVFGEAILGVINSMSEIRELSVSVWLYFGLGILIVFALWWIFFSAIADRQSKRGIWADIIISFIYIPMLSSLGMVGASFPSLMEKMTTNEHHFSSPLQIIFGASIAVFLCCITILSLFLVHPPEYANSKMFAQKLLVFTGIANMLLMLLYPFLPIIIYLSIVFVSLLIVIVFMTRSWFLVELRKINKQKKSFDVTKPDI